MWILLHAGHNQSGGAETTSSSAGGPELMVLTTLALLAVGITAVYVAKRYTDD